MGTVLRDVLGECRLQHVSGKCWDEECVCVCVREAYTYIREEELN